MDDLDDLAEFLDGHYPPDGFDYLGDPLPPGYKAWICDICTAV